MSTKSGGRLRAALVASATLVAAVAGTASATAAAAGPTAPTKLFNDGQHCSTDPTAPTYLAGTDGVVLEGVPQDAAAAGDDFGAQYLLWPVSAPTQTTTYASSVTDYPAGVETPTDVPGSALTDGSLYAWQARSLIDGSAVSKWSKTCYIAIDDDAPSSAPTVTSANYPAGQASPGGVPVQFTFGASGVSDVAGYEFVWDTGELPVVADTPPWADTDSYVQAPTLGGDASVNLIPPPGWGPHTLTVASLDRAYNISTSATYQIYVDSTAPTITSAVQQPQFDTPTEFTFTPNPTAEAASPIVSYSVSIGSGTARTVKAGADGSATVKLKLEQVDGSDNVTVSSTSANGWVSDPAFNHYYFDTTPIVASTDYPGPGSGGVDVPGTFTFTHQVPNIVSYTYSFDRGATETTVAADKAGDAQITWTPTASGGYDLNVYGTTKDGLKLQYTDYYFAVN